MPNTGIHDQMWALYGHPGCSRENGWVLGNKGKTRRAEAGRLYRTRTVAWVEVLMVSKVRLKRERKWTNGWWGCLEGSCSSYISMGQGKDGG